MDEVKLKLDQRGQGSFYITDGVEQIGEMVVSIGGANLTVYHTEVAAKAEGKGLASKMLSAMVDYVRKHELKVIALCPFVHAQFRRHPETYADIWNREAEMEDD